MVRGYELLAVAGLGSRGLDCVQRAGKGAELRRGVGPHG